MGTTPPGSREAGRLWAMSQVGVEMVVPIGIGLFLDNRFGWAPWGVAVGAVLGLVGGLWHLVYLSRRFEDQERASRQDGP